VVAEEEEEEEEEEEFEAEEIQRRSSACSQHPPSPALLPDPRELALALASSCARTSAFSISAASTQGLTLVHFSAQRKRFVWNMGCMQGLFSGYSWGFRGYERVSWVFFVSEPAQVELKGGRV